MVKNNIELKNLVYLSKERTTDDDGTK